MLTSSYANYNIDFVMSNQDCRQDIIYLIRHLSKLLEADFDNRIAKMGLTGTQARILFFIERETNANRVVHQNDIEREFSLAKSSVNGLISRMVKGGFITKKNKSKFVVLEMTGLAYDALAELKQGRVETVNKLFTGYDEETKQQTIEKLNKILENFEGGDGNA